jgi:hypothetical protein
LSEPLPDLPDLCWPVDWSCVDEEWLESLDAGVRARAEALAVSSLRALTAYQVGGCPVIVRPCAEGCAPPRYMEAIVTSASAGALGARVGPWWPHINVDGAWVNTGCGCTAPCSCTFVPEVILPAPVGAVVEVNLDGALLDPSAYRVDNGNRLVRTDGQAWPKCQDMAAPAGSEGTFSVRYLNSWPVDGLGSYAAGKLAYEFAQACTGGKCALPNGVQTISRLGVTLEIPTGMFENGVTGIIEVDSWVRMWNPNALKMPSTVWTPGTRRARQTTWRPA